MKRRTILGASFAAGLIASAHAAGVLATGNGGIVAAQAGGKAVAAAGASGGGGGGGGPSVTFINIPATAVQYASFGGYASWNTASFPTIYLSIVKNGSEEVRYPITPAGTPGAQTIALPAQVGALGAGSYQLIAWSAAAGGTNLGASAAIAVSALPAYASVTNLAGLWDASSPGAAAPTTITTLADTSGNGNAATLSGPASGAGIGYLATARGWMIGPRYNGMLSGLLNQAFGNNAWGSYQTNPIGTFLCGNALMSVPGVTLGSSQAWSLVHVFSNPGPSQVDMGTVAFTSGSRAILAANGTVFVSQTNSGTAALDTLTVFGTAVFTSLPMRGTHVLGLINTPGSGISVYLNGALIASGLTNSFGATLLATLYVGNDGANSGKFIFHTLATYTKSLAAGDISALLTGAGALASMWASPVLGSQTGARKGKYYMLAGQSNANYLATGASGTLGVPGGGMQNAAELMRAICGDVAGFTVYGFPSGGTDFSGQNFYGTGSAIFSSTTGSPSSWPLGTNGTATVTALTWAAAQPMLANCQPVMMFAWSENNSAGVYGTSTAATHSAALQQYAALVRSTLFPSLSGAPLVASVPLILSQIWAYNVYGAAANGQGLALALGVEAALAANNNILPGCRQMGDVIPIGSTWNPANGTFTNGTGPGAGGQHMDYTTCDALLGIRIGHIGGVNLVLAGYSNFSAVPIGVPRAGGPSVSGVSLSANTLTLTISPDPGLPGAGLNLALQGLAGAGWTYLDNVTANAPGGGSSTGVIQASGAAVTSATSMTVTLASTPSSSAANGLVYYPYGMSLLGGYAPSGGSGTYQTNAVTDNWASLSKPFGWDVGLALGMPVNLPLQPTLGLVA